MSLVHGGDAPIVVGRAPTDWRRLCSRFALSMVAWPAVAEACRASARAEADTARTMAAMRVGVPQWRVSTMAIGAGIERLRPLARLGPRPDGIMRKKLRRYARTIGKMHTY